MTIRNQLKLLVTAGSLIAASLANPVQRPLTHNDDDDENDTPLPVVIWHGRQITPTIEKSTTTNAYIPNTRPRR